MKTFQCNCKDQPTLFFESNHCIACDKTVGLDDEFNQVESYDLDEESGQFLKQHSQKFVIKNVITMLNSKSVMAWLI